LLPANTSIAHYRDLACQIFLAGTKAADPALAVTNALNKSDLDVSGKIILLAIGKAACPMTIAALAELPKSPSKSIVVTNPENVTDIEGCSIFGAAHPVPDQIGIDAARTVEAALEGLTKDDLVITLISGGGSSLLPAPVNGMDLSDKISLNDELLKSGLDITRMNIVRQQVSRLKGGGLAAQAAPARLLSLILSDVPNDNPAIVASGLTALPMGTPLDAIQILKENNIWNSVTPAVRNALENKEPLNSDFPDTYNTIIGSNRLSVLAALKNAEQSISATAIDGWLDGEVSEVAQKLLTDAKNMGDVTAPTALIYGGETTVNIKGSGKGGRNQELALRFAKGAENMGLGENWVFLSAGTDVRDGPTDAAGATVDAGTLSRVQAKGLDIEDILANNDAYNGLLATDDLIITGGTGTNVADIQVIIRW